MMLRGFFCEQLCYFCIFRPRKLASRNKWKSYSKYIFMATLLVHIMNIMYFILSFPYFSLLLSSCSFQLFLSYCSSCHFWPGFSCPSFRRFCHLFLKLCFLYVIIVMKIPSFFIFQWVRLAFIAVTSFSKEPIPRNSSKSSTAT